MNSACHSESHDHGHGSHDHGHGGHSHSHGDGPPPATNVAQLLNLKIDLAQVVGLNLQNAPDEVGKLFKDASRRYELKPVIKSDADEQLILHIPFLNGSVKLHSVILRTNGSRFCPKTVKLWKNARHIDFDNVHDTKATYTVTHPQVGVPVDDDHEMPDELVAESTFVEHHLPRHTFSGVRSLTLFVEDIYGDEEEAHLHSIELRGEFTELTRDPVIALYEVAPNPAYHKVPQESRYRVDY